MGLIAGILAGKDEVLAEEILKSDGFLGTCHEILKDDVQGDAGLSVFAILDGLSVCGTDLRKIWNKETGDQDLSDVCGATISNIEIQCENPEAVAMAIDGFVSLVDPNGHDIAGKKLLLNPGVSAICAKFESNSSIRRAMARLSGTLPPVGEEVAEQISICIEFMKSSDLTGASKSLSLIMSALLAPVENPKKNLSNLGKLLTILNDHVKNNSTELLNKNVGLMSCRLFNQLSMKYREEEAFWEFGHGGVLTAGCPECMLMVTARQHNFSSRGASVKQSCDAMALMAESTPTREKFLELHSYNPVLPELIEDFETQPDVKASIINLLAKIISGAPSKWLNKVLENAAWRNKALEILMGQQITSLDPTKLAGFLDTLTTMSLLAGTPMQESPEGMALMQTAPDICAIVAEAEVLDPNLEGPLMDHIGALFRIPEAREDAYKELSAGCRQLPVMDYASPFRGRYVSSVV